MRPLVPLLALATLAGCSKHAEAEHAAEPVEVHCQHPAPAAIDETVALRGRLEPPPGGDLPVASQVGGRVVSVAVHEGQHVAAGDLIASVDDAPSRDAVRQAEAAVLQARAADVNATAALERTRVLVSRGIAARQELEDATARAEAAHAGVAAVVAGADLARRTLGRVAVRSSFSGTVTRVWRGPGALVDGTAATPIVQLAAVKGVELVADATQRELSSLEEGQGARVELSIGGEALTAVVRARSSMLDAATGLGTVRLTIEGFDGKAAMGTYGRVVIATAHRDAALVLPSSVMRGAVADGAEVVVCKGDKAALRTIKVGWRDEARIEVLEGLTAEDAVATDHVLGLEDDTPIKQATK